MMSGPPIVRAEVVPRERQLRLTAVTMPLRGWNRVASSAEPP